MVKRIMSRKLTAKALVDAYNEALTQYSASVQKDRYEAVNNGVTNLPKGFYNPDNEKAANGHVYALMYAAIDTIKQQKEAVKDRLTEAPSYEAQAYAATINPRSDLTREEIEAGLDRYHDHNTQHVILAGAKRSGFLDYGDKTEVEVYSQDLDAAAEAVKSIIEPFNISEAVNSPAKQLIHRATLERIGEQWGNTLQAFAGLSDGVGEE